MYERQRRARIPEPHLPVAYHRGRFMPVEEATVNIMTHGFQYGIGCFAGVRAYYRPEEDQLYLFRLADHMRRLANSCRILQFPVELGAAEMEAIVLELARRNDYHGDCYFRPFVYSAEHRLTPRAHDVRFEFSAYGLPLRDYIDTRKGLRVKVSSWRRVADDQIPARAKATGAYLGSALAKSEALQAGCDEAIFLNHDGTVSEGSAENLFLVRDGVLITPPVTANLLEGITRATILTLAEDLGLEVAERPVHRTELYVADEAFFTGTGAQVAWIREIDGRAVGGGEPGPVTVKLRSLYEAVVRGRVERYREWVTPVFLREAPRGAGEAAGASGSRPG